MVDEDSDILKLTGAVLSPGKARRSWLWRTAASIAPEVERIARRAAPLKVDDWSIAHLDGGR